MSKSYSLPTEPEGEVATLPERFNSGKVSAMMSLYAPEAVFIAKDGTTITDHTEIAAMRLAVGEQLPPSAATPTQPAPVPGPPPVFR
jgi:hypothetical protein